MKQIKHIAIIMDGNGRWAKAQNKERTYGHKVGTQNVRNIAIHANDLNIEALTLYAFSTENWTRPQKEVAYLMRLPRIFLDEHLQELIDNNIKLTAIGKWEELPKATVDAFKQAIETTKNNTGMVLNLAMNYGSKDEIVTAINALMSRGIKKINEKDIEGSLMTAHLPPVDLCIRTGGEKRLSNFLLWQLAYSELYFTNVSWPEFDKEHLKKAIDEFSSRDRRYGGLK